MIGSENSESNSGFGGVVTAKGTAEGLILRIDGRVPNESVEEALSNFISTRESFLTGNSVILEWLGKEKEETFISTISKYLEDNFRIKVKTSRLKSKNKPLRSDGQYFDDRQSLFDGMEKISVPESTKEARHSLETEVNSGFSSVEGVKALLLDEPDARVVYGTMRSGQRIESDHTLVIIGDVNSGAELVAGGDIVVLGNLRGVAHAGAFDETGAGCFIFALALQPTQLRIGNMISRGEPEKISAKKAHSEIARVDGNHIVVEKFNSRKFSFKV